MNRQAPHSVPAHSKRQIGVILTLLAVWASLSVQCVDIDGGAAELTWSLRTIEGESIAGEDCQSARISKIRLCWNSLEDGDSGCRPGQFRDFACEEENGVTLFEIPPGRAKFNVEPICLDGRPAAIGTYQGPPEIVRMVRDAEVVTLAAFLIAVPDPKTCSGIECTCIRE